MGVDTRKCDACQERYNNAIRQVAIKLRLSRHPFLCACIAEFFGTTILIIFGLGCSAQKTLGNYTNRGDFLSMSINWGIGLSMGLFVSGVMGHGLMNPALTFAFALIGKVPFIRVIPYTLCQFFGAWVGALLLLAVYNQQIYKFTVKYDHGMRLMNDTGAIFVTRPTVSHGYCVMDQIFGTAILAGMALAIVDKHNFNVPGTLQPIYIGMLLTGLQSAVWINCGAALNPARDLGPRVALLMCGWGSKSFSDSDYYFWIPVVGPYVGALAGAIAYELLVGMHLHGVYDEWEKQNLQDRDNSSVDATHSSDDSNSLRSSGDEDEDEEAIVVPCPRHSRVYTNPDLNRRLTNANRPTTRVSPGTSVGTSTGTVVIDYDPE